jgi:hypothetical protein
MSELYTGDECTERSDKAWHDGLKHGQAESAARIAAQESELFKLRLKETAIAPGVEAMAEEADKMRKQYEAKIERLTRLLRKFYPHELDNTDIFPQLPAGETALTDAGLVTSIPWGSGIAVSCQIRIRDGNEGKTIEFGAVNYPFDVEHLRNDLNQRIPSLLRCSPLPEELKGIVLPNFVTKETFWLVLNELALYRYHPSLKDREKRYFDVLDHLFKDRISREVHKTEDKNNARKIFRAAVHDAFTRMEKNGRGIDTGTIRGSAGRRRITEWAPITDWLNAENG